MFFDIKSNRFSPECQYERQNLPAAGTLPYLLELGEFETTGINIAENSLGNLNAFLCLYVIRGFGSVSHNGDIEVLFENDILIINTRQRFIISSDDWKIKYFIYGDPGNLTNEKFRWLRLNGCTHQSQVIQLFNDFSYLIKSKERNLYHEGSLILSIIGHLENETRLAKNSDETDRIRLAMAYIENEFKNTIYLEDLSALTGYSKFHFSRRFMAITGLSPSQYIIKKRINHAKSLLVSSSLAIPEISRMSGFANPANFFIQFKKATTRSPAEFRKLFNRKDNSL
jgi:AraC-like DNA-binding protein